MFFHYYIVHITCLPGTWKKLEDIYIIVPIGFIIVFSSEFQENKDKRQKKKERDTERLFSIYTFSSFIHQKHHFSSFHHILHRLATFARQNRLSCLPACFHDIWSDQRSISSNLLNYFQTTSILLQLKSLFSFHLQRFLKLFRGF